MATPSSELVDLASAVSDDRGYGELRLKTVHIDTAAKSAKLILVGYDSTAETEKPNTRTDINVTEEGTTVNGHLVDKAGKSAESTLTYSDLVTGSDQNGFRIGVKQFVKNVLGE